MRKQIRCFIALVLLLALVALPALAQKVTTDPNFWKEVDFLRSKGYFDLPGDHKVNGTSVADWNKWLNGREAIAARSTALGEGAATRSTGAAAGSAGRFATAGRFAKPVASKASSALVGALGAIFLRDFVLEMSQLDPITGDRMPASEYLRQHPEAGLPWIFDFTGRGSWINPKQSNQAPEYSRSNYRSSEAYLKSEYSGRNNYGGSQAQDYPEYSRSNYRTSEAYLKSEYSGRSNYGGSQAQDYVVNGINYGSNFRSTSDFERWYYTGKREGQ